MHNPTERINHSRFYRIFGILKGVVKENTGCLQVIKEEEIRGEKLKIENLFLLFLDNLTDILESISPGYKGSLGG